MKSGSKKWADATTRPSLFDWCIPKSGVALLRRPCFHPIKGVKTATWSHSVHSEDFLVAVASDVLEMRLPDPSANLASISSAKRLKARDNVQRFDTIFTEFLMSPKRSSVRMTTFHLQVERPGHLCSRVGRRPSRRNERRFNRQLLRFGARSLQEIRSKSARLWQKTKQRKCSDLMCLGSVSLSECVDGWCNVVFLGVRV